MTPQPLRILLTSMGCTASQNLVLALKDDPFSYVLGGDGRALHGGIELPDELCQLPMGSDNDYISTVLSLINKHKIDLFIPVMEPELKAASDARDELHSAGVKVLLSSPRALEICFSKAKLAKTLEKLDIPTPVLYSSDEDIVYPAFARPDFGTGSRGSLILRNASELDYARSKSGPLTLTEYIEGDEFSIDAFAKENGELIHAICRQRIEVKGGLAVRSQVVEMGEALDDVRKISKELQLFGFFNLQFRQVASGKRLYFDLNPRLGGAMALSFAAGLQAPALLQGVFTGHWPSAPLKTAIGTQLLRRWHNIILPSVD